MQISSAASETRRTRSYSQLESYQKCSWAFYLRRIRRLPELPSMWSPGGTAFHAATEAFDRATWRLPLAGFDDIKPWQDRFLEIFETELDELRAVSPDESEWRVSQKNKTKKNPAGEDAAWWRQHGSAMVGRYIQWRISTDDTLVMAAVESGPAVEVEVRALLGGVPVVAIIDRVFQDRNTGVAEIVDLKTGRRMPEKTTQLGHYSVLYEMFSGQPTTWGTFYDARKGSLAEVYDLTVYTAYSIAEQYVWLDRAIALGEFFPNITYLCSACGVRKWCKYQGGSEPS